MVRRNLAGILVSVIYGLYMPVAGFSGVYLSWRAIWLTTVLLLLGTTGFLLFAYLIGSSQMAISRNIENLSDRISDIRNGNSAANSDVPMEGLFPADHDLSQTMTGLEGSRVHVTLKTDGGLAVTSVQNTSRCELSKDKDFTERFVRGDQSRTDGGSGLGLSIAQSFTEACGGTFRLETIADLFVVTVSFSLMKG